VDVQAREILKLRERMNRILADHTGQPIEQIEKDTERDYYMSGEEALAYGVIDRVVKRHQVSAPRGPGPGGKRK
jgi:ATP-dependent Clp protease protease subunit